MKLILVLALQFMIFQTQAQDLPQFLQITAGVFRGGRLDTEQMTDLYQNWHQPGAQFLIIDLQGGDPLESLMGISGESVDDIELEKAQAQASGFQFISEPLSSFASVDFNEQNRIQDSLALMQKAARAPEALQVYIHCQRGIDRTGLVAALFRVQFLKWAPADAYQEWLELGHSDFIGSVLSRALDQYFFEVTHWSPPYSVN
jgi:protein-tyrosine phosphatase